MPVTGKRDRVMWESCLAAIRIMSSTFDTRRRWELMVYPTPEEARVVQFKYDLHFDKMVDFSEVPPVPFSHDETIKAACLAVAEKDVEDVQGGAWDYYKSSCLPNSYRVNSRSAPRALGYFGNPQAYGSGGSRIRAFRNGMYDRPAVTFNP